MTARTMHQPGHLDFVDGMRGMAALYVVLGHVYVYTRPWSDEALPGPAREVLKLIDQGHSAVAVFIVISGFCLMMPLSKRELRRPVGGNPTFLRRRAKRILPPYLAALALSIVLVATFRSIRSPADLSAKSILMHFGLVANLSEDTMFTINGPMWSVVLECQIYVLFIILLLPAYRRFGFSALVATAFAVGLVPYFLLPSGWDLGWTFPWYLGLFALGCGSAQVVFSKGDFAERARAWSHWGTASAALVVGVLLVVVFALSEAYEQLWAFDTLIGLATAAIIIRMALRSCASTDRRGATYRFLSSPRVVALGVFSYSLYLIHEPILRLLAVRLHSVVENGVFLLILEAGIGVPLVIGVAYGFYLLFEKPFKPAPSMVPRAPALTEPVQEPPSGPTVADPA